MELHASINIERHLHAPSIYSAFIKPDLVLKVYISAGRLIAWVTFGSSVSLLK